MAPVKTDTFQNYVIYIFILFEIITSAWLLGSNDHELMKYWYAFVQLSLFGTRIYSFYRKDYLLYLFEMCYIVNIISIFIVPTNYCLKYIYPFFHGPLMAYALVYGDAIVLHDLDRTTSYAIHTFGAIFTRRFYWNNPEENYLTLENLTLTGFGSNILISVQLYLCWAVPYTLLYLIPYNGTSPTMLKYVARMKNDDVPSLFQKMMYISSHFLFITIALIIGNFSMYCWQFNYFMVALQVLSGFLNGGWYYYTGKKLNPKKALSEALFAVKNTVKVNKDTKSLEISLKDDALVIGINGVKIKKIEEKQM